MDFDFPIQTKVIAKGENPFAFNEGKNMEVNNDIPQGMDDFNPYKDEDKVIKILILIIWKIMKIIIIMIMKQEIFWIILKMK